MVYYHGWYGKAYIAHERVKSVEPTNSDVLDAPTPQKKPYAPPSLVSYGTVEKLTRSGGSETNLDHSGLSMRMPGGGG
jgi:hypothetical protein